MPYNVEKQIQEAMERGDFENLTGMGKQQALEENPFVPRDTRIVNQMLKDNGFAPRWIEVDKEIRAESEDAEQLLVTIRKRRGRLESVVRAQPPKRYVVYRTFELERRRALETYTSQLNGLNQKILRYKNLTVPAGDRQKPMYNLDTLVAHFHKECPSL